MQQTDRQTIFSPSTLASTQGIAQSFATATPFKHVIIDNFFEPRFAAALLQSFPAFDQSKAIDEYGGKSRKAVVESLSDLAEPFREADSFFASAQFLDWVSVVTGIHRLVYNPDNYGGGTHDNLEGQELLPHVDFNYHPKTGHHRRLNLIVYLNEGWQEDWGGSIQVHSNPRDAASNQVRSFPPTFNRCIIFETNERSWHGFDRIKLPDSQKGNSRKSLSIYLYTSQRPNEESFASHGTFYVPRPLPSDFAPGKVLSAEDIATLQYLLRTRDDLIELQQKKEADREGAAATLARYAESIKELVKHLPVPLIGYGTQIGETSGLFPDKWCGAEARFSIRAMRNISAITVSGRFHPALPRGSALIVRVNESEIARVSLGSKLEVEVTGRVTLQPGESVDVRISCPTVVPANVQQSEDRRDIGFHLYQILLEGSK